MANAMTKTESAMVIATDGNNNILMTGAWLCLSMNREVITLLSLGSSGTTRLNSSTNRPIRLTTKRERYKQ